MTEIKAQIEISADAQAVWKVLADLGGVKNFHPFVEDSYYTSHDETGEQAARICEFYNGMVVRESAIEWQEGKEYTLSIEMLEGPTPPIENLLGTLSIEPINDTSSRASMKISYDPKGLMGKIMNPLMIQPQYSKMVPSILQGLKQHMETGETIVNPTTLKELQLNTVHA